MEDCIFCKIVEGKIAADIVYEDERIVCFRDIHPKARVHILIVCKTHIENLQNLQEKDHALIAHMLAIQPEIAKQEGLYNGFRTVINTGPGGGQEINHLHFHLLGGSLPKF